MIPLYPPRWAEVFGEDDFGIFAEFVLKDVRFAWRWIAPGRFLMGSPAEEVGGWEAEGPQHEVTLTRGFWMGETPITQAQWGTIMKENPSRFRGEHRPVENVTWHDSEAFATGLCEAVPRLRASLPTDAQWEYACRAGTCGAFHDDSACTQPWGKDPALELLGWYGENSGSETHDVRGKRPNAWGLYDMHGNVWEWCRDGWYDYDAEPAEDPFHAPKGKGDGRVVRGGSWANQARYCRAASRNHWVPGSRLEFQGFRLVAGEEFRAAEPRGAGRLLVGSPRRSRD